MIIFSNSTFIPIISFMICRTVHLSSFDRPKYATAIFTRSSFNSMEKTSELVVQEQDKGFEKDQTTAIGRLGEEVCFDSLPVFFSKILSRKRDQDSFNTIELKVKIVDIFWFNRVGQFVLNVITVFGPHIVLSSAANKLSTILNV